MNEKYFHDYLMTNVPWRNVILRFKNFLWEINHLLAEQCVGNQYQNRL